MARVEGRVPGVLRPKTQRNKPLAALKCSVTWSFLYTVLVMGDADNGRGGKCDSQLELFFFTR